MSRLGRAQPFKPLIRGIVRPANVTLALTGVVATAAVGTLGMAFSLGLTGVTGSGAVGTVVPGTTFGLTGVSTTGSIPTAPSGLGYAQQVVADGANHYWRLGESAGTVAVDQIGAANATIAGAVTLGQPGALTDGNTAMAFNGGPAQASVTSPALTFPTPYTVELWVNTSDPTLQYQNWFSNEPLPSVGDSIRIGLDDGAGYCFCYFNDGSTAFVVSSGAALNDGLWHHIVVVLQAAQADLYVDGGLVNTTTTGIHFTTPVTLPILMGFDPALFSVGAPETFVGRLDEIATYPTALSPSQIAHHHTLQGESGLSPRFDIPSTGVVGTGVVRTATPTSSGANLTLPLTGLSSTSSIGSVTPSLTALLTGISSAGTVGSVVFGQSFSLTGVTATGTVGTVTPVTLLTVALVGVQATGSVGNTHPPNTFISQYAANANQLVGPIAPQPETH